MATIVEGMDAGTAAAAAVPQPTAPIVLDDAALDRLADLLRARILPARPAWQTSLLVALAGALIAAATAGYFSLRSDIASLGTSLRAEMTAGDASLRAEIASVEENLRAELLDFRAEFHRVTLDHTERLTRVETVQAQHTELLAQHTERLAHIDAVQAQHTERLAHIDAVQAQHTERLTHIDAVQAQHTARLTHIEAAHPHPAAQ